MKPLFCIFAHPDDEAFGPGGAIATFAKEREVYLICVTDGNAKKEHQTIQYENLKEVRREELLESARILGIKEVFFLNFSDGMLCNNTYHDVTTRVEEILEEYQPDTLMTFENRGVSGHLDHIAVSMITSFIFQRQPSITKLLYYCESEEVISKMRDDYFVCMPPGFERENVDLVVDTAGVWETKLEAMHAHKSQQKDIDRMLAILIDKKHEEYFLTVQK